MPVLQSYLGTKAVNLLNSDDTVVTREWAICATGFTGANVQGNYVDQIILWYGNSPQAVGTHDYRWAYINIGKNRNTIESVTPDSGTTFTATDGVVMRMNYNGNSSVVGIELFTRSGGTWTPLLQIGSTGEYTDVTYIHGRQDTSIVIPSYYTMLAVELHLNDHYYSIEIQFDPTTISGYRLRIQEDTTVNCSPMPYKEQFDGLPTLKELSIILSAIGDAQITKAINKAVEITTTNLSKTFVSR